jgi:ubiquitin-protein ligase E3 C
MTYAPWLQLLLPRWRQDRVRGPAVVCQRLTYVPTPTLSRPLFHLAHTGGHPALCASAADPAAASTAQLRACRLVALCSACLGQGGTTEAIARVMTLLTTRASWPAPPSGTARPHADAVLSRLALRNVAALVSRCAEAHQPADPEVQRLIGHLWARSLLDMPAAGNTRATAHFLQFLAIPHIWRACPSLASDSQVRAHLWVPTLRAVTQHTPVEAAVATQLLANLVGMAAGAGHTWCHASAVAFAQASSALLARMPVPGSRSSVDPTSGVIDDDPPSDAEDGGGTDADGDALMGDAQAPLPPQELQALWEPAFVRACIVAALTPDAASPQDAGVHAACALLHAVLHRLLRHAPEARHLVMSSLAFTGDVVPRLWRSIARAPASGVSAQPLAVLASVYSHALITADDEELSGGSASVLAGDDNVALVRLLRDVLWHALWLEPRASKWPRSVVKPVARLFGQLHARNGRHQFVPPIEFCAPELSGDEDCDLAQRLLADAVADDAATEAIDPMDGPKTETRAQRGLASRAGALLRVAPALVPFLLRARLFRERCERDRENVLAASTGGAMLPWHVPPTTLVTVRRDALFEDGFTGLGPLRPDQLKGILRVRFVNELGAPEAGVDGGGLFKDFLDGFWGAAFRVPGLWNATEDNRVSPNPRSGADAGANHLQLYRFAGSMLARAMYEGILAETPLADFLFAKLRGDGNALHDLASLDVSLHRSLLALKRYTGDHGALCLSFTVSDGGRDVALVPGGHSVPVTASNKLTYIHLVAHYKLTASIRQQCGAFVGGFHSVIPPRWVAMFSPGELSTLLSGSRNPRLDVGDLAAHAAYSGGYTRDHPTVKALWEVVQGMSGGEQCAFLKFVTACSRPPLLGFRHLQPQFTVHRSGVPTSDAPDEAADMERLPTSATCLALLKLPPYRSVDELRSKLVMAITSHAGFDLS